MTVARTRSVDVVARENRIKALKLAIDVIDFRFQQLLNAHARANCLLCKAYDDLGQPKHCEGCPASHKNPDKPEYSCVNYDKNLNDIAVLLKNQQNLFRQELEILKKKGAGR